MKIKIISIGLIVLTIAFSILCCLNIFNNSRSFYERELDETHQELLENLEFQDELKGYGSRYYKQLDTVETAEESLREWMWTCQQKINAYKQKSLIFGLAAVGCGISTVVLIIINKKRKVCLL